MPAVVEDNGQVGSRGLKTGRSLVQALQLRADPLLYHHETLVMPRRLADPEAQWPRTAALPTVDRKLLRRIFAKWPDLADRHWTLLSGGQRSLNLRAGDIVARIDFDNPARLRKEAAVLKAVAARVRVPRVLDQAEGVLLLEYVRHESLPATELAGRRVGATAAMIHTHAFETSGLFDENLDITVPFESSLRGLRNWAEERLAGGAAARLGSLVSDVRTIWDRYAAMMAAASMQAVLVHADFKIANVKWIAAEQEVLVLDWEFAWAGPALFDIGQLLRWRPAPAFVRGFSQGYAARGGLLPQHWERLAALFDLFNLVGFLEHEQPHQERDADVLRRISETLSHVNAARL